jgi:hypothetical protein
MLDLMFRSADDEQLSLDTAPHNPVKIIQNLGGIYSLHVKTEV